uniref:Nucleoporin n=1 Tax=Neospora caninum (strain Liverpool) TaxID=572307 RepID=A0A0F7UFK4_NEOCL|nr:TPA: hypothetical protein BN1204_044750 [Neospora caninum Liverpool]
MFGSAGASATSGGRFGASSAQPAGGGLFGSSASAQTAPGGASATTGMGLFGSTPAATGGLFGSASGGAAGTAGTAQSGGGLFGAGGAAGTAGTAQSGGGLFGTGATTATGAGGASLFGGGAQKPATGGTTGLFGGGTAAAGTAGGGGLFGSSQAAKPATGGLFGAPAAQNTGATGGLFGAQPSGTTAAPAGVVVLPREPTVANIDRVVPGVLEKFKKIEEKMREEERVMNELQTATRKMKESFSGFSSSLSAHQSRVSWAFHHVLVLKRQAQNLAPVVQRDKQLALQVEQLHQQLEQNITAANASLARASSVGAARDAVYVVPLQVPCPLSTPLYQQLLQDVWSVSGRLQQLEQHVKLLRLERENAARASCPYADEAYPAGGDLAAGSDFHSEIQMIKEVLDSQREVLLATAQKALELRETTRRMQDHLERLGVKIPVFPEDQEEAAVNAMAVQASQSTGGWGKRFVMLPQVDTRAALTLPDVTGHFRRPIWRVFGAAGWRRVVRQLCIGPDGSRRRLCDDRDGSLRVYSGGNWRPVWERLRRRSRDCRDRAVWRRPLWNRRRSRDCRDRAVWRRPLWNRSDDRDGRRRGESLRRGRAEAGDGRNDGTVWRRNCGRRDSGRWGPVWEFSGGQARNRRPVWSPSGAEHGRDRRSLWSPTVRDGREQFVRQHRWRLIWSEVAPAARANRWGIVLFLFNKSLLDLSICG